MKPETLAPTLSPDLLHKMDAYWRAANYLSVGQLYLYDNPLLKEPLKLSHVKPLVVGHWGTTPGQNFIYVHLNRVIKKYDHIKAQWALFQQISADTKDLDDIPRYWPQAQRLQLPVIQYTARDVRSGLLFWSFAQARSASASAVFASRIQQHLDRYGVSLRDLVWQTDNGGEFKGDFPKALGDSQHVRIPPAAYTFQSDVETVHRLEEDEFFDLEDFSDRSDFLAKAHTYQLYFNLARPNSHKENLSPWQIIERLAPRSPLQLCLLPPVFLDYYLNDAGGYDVPRLPY
jgi:hypothetical protein